MPKIQQLQLKFNKKQNKIDLSEMIANYSKNNLTTQQSQASFQYIPQQYKNTVIVRHSSRAYIHPPVSQPSYNIINSSLTSLPSNQYCEKIAQLNGLNAKQKQNFTQSFRKNQANRQQRFNKINQSAQIRSYKQALQRKCFQNKVKRQIGNFPVFDKASLIRERTQFSDVNNDRHNVNFFYSASVRNLNTYRSQRYLS